MMLKFREARGIEAAVPTRAGFNTKRPPRLTFWCSAPTGDSHVDDADWLCSLHHDRLDWNFHEPRVTNKCPLSHVCRVFFKSSEEGTSTEPYLGVIRGSEAPRIRRPHKEVTVQTGRHSVWEGCTKGGLWRRSQLPTKPPPGRHTLTLSSVWGKLKWN